MFTCRPILHTFPGRIGHSLQCGFGCLTRVKMIGCLFRFLLVLLWLVRATAPVPEECRQDGWWPAGGARRRQCCAALVAD